MIAPVERWRDEVGDTHALGAARVALGLLLLVAALRAAGELRDGFFGDAFHWPIVAEALVPSRGVYWTLVAAEVVAAALVVVGLWARIALFASALGISYGLMCDRLQFHNNRWALACYAMLLALSPCDRCFALRAASPALGAKATGPLWAARLAQLQVSIIYLASGGSKLFDADWRGGRVLSTRMLLYGGNAVDAGVPRWMVDLLAAPAIASGLAKAAIATELLLAVGLWPRRTRAFFLWCGVWFHLTIEATSRVEGFTWLTLAMYALFATPDFRARTIEVGPSPGAKLGAQIVARLDWLARFEMSLRRDVGDRGLSVVARDKTRMRGLHALAEVARCTPLLFPLWLPLAGAARLTRRARALTALPSTGDRPSETTQAPP